MRFHEPEYVLLLLEKMPTAFFGMSRSISTSFNTFLTGLSLSAQESYWCCRYLQNWHLQ